MNPGQMKSMLSKMGIKTEVVDAIKVVIETNDKNIVIENPQITKISAQGSVSFQVGGEVHEEQKQIAVDITNDDVKMVMDQAGISDEQKARDALENSEGDIAAAILELKNGIQ